MPKSTHITWADALRQGIVTPAQAQEAQRTRPGLTAVPAPYTPQEVLTHACKQAWPGHFTPNYKPLRTRRFELDLAHVPSKLGVEVDGWQFHGKHKAGFKRDREKDNLLVVAGWRVLRFPASQIIDDVASVLDMIRQAMPGKGTHAL